MRVLNALIVDEIRDREDGGIDLIGLRQDLFFDALPIILERMTLYVELEVGLPDRGKRHTIEFRLVEGETGRVMQGASLTFTLPPDHPRPSAPLDPTLFELPFERFGPHYLDILISGEPDRRITIAVLPNEAYGNA